MSRTRDQSPVTRRVRGTALEVRSANNDTNDYFKGLEFLTPQTLAFLNKKWERERWANDTFAGFVYKEFETELSELRIESILEDLEAAGMKAEWAEHFERFILLDPINDSLWFWVKIFLIGREQGFMCTLPDWIQGSPTEFGVSQDTSIEYNRPDESGSQDLWVVRLDATSLAVREKERQDENNFFCSTSLENANRILKYGFDRGDFEHSRCLTNLHLGTGLYLCNNLHLAKRYGRPYTLNGPQDDSTEFAILSFKWDSDVLASFDSGSVDVRDDPEKFLKILDFYQAEMSESDEKMLSSHGLGPDFLESTSYIHAPDTLDGRDSASAESGSEQICVKSYVLASKLLSQCLLGIFIFDTKSDMDS